MGSVYACGWTKVGAGRGVVAEQPRRVKRHIAAALSMAMALAASPVFATSGNWTGAAGDGLWATTGNWSASPVPGSADTATFNVGTGTTVSLGAGGVSLTNLIFDTSSVGSYTIGSGAVGSQTLTLPTSGTIVMNATVINDQLINAKVSAANATGVYNASLTNRLTLASDVAAGAGNTFNVGGVGSVAINGVVSGGFINKINPGTLTLTAANTYNGYTKLEQGTISLDFSAGITASNIISTTTSSMRLGLWDPTLSIKFISGATTNTQTFAATFFNGNSAVRVVQNGNTSSSSQVQLGALSRITPGTTDFTLPTTGSLNTTSTAAGFLMGTNNVLAVGSVAFASVDGTNWATNNAGAIGALSAYQTDAFAAALDTDITTSDAPAAFTVNTVRFSTANNTLTLNSSGASTVTAGGILTTAAATGSVIASGGAGAALQPGNKELVFLSYGDVAVNVPIVDNGANATAVTLGGSGTTTLGAANTFAGTTTLNKGTLKLTNANALQNSAALTLNTGTLALRGDGATTFLLGGGTINVNGSVTIDVDQATAGNLNNQLSLGNSSSSFNISGLLGNQYGYVTLTVTGAHGSSLNLGTLQSASAVRTMVLNPTTANMTAAGIGTLNAQATWVLDGTSNNNIIGAILGTASTIVTKSNTSTWTLTGANTYAGVTTITGGTLTITGSLNSTTGSAVTVSGGTLNLNAANAVTKSTVTVAGGTLTENTADALNGTVALTVNNVNSNAVLSAANHYSGATTLSAGNLQLRDASSLVSSALTMSGGTLQLRNDTNNTAFSYASATISGNVTFNVDRATGSGATGNTLALGNLSTAGNVITVTNADNYNLTLGTVTSSAGPTFTNNMTSGTLTLGALTLTPASAQTATFNGTSATAITSVGLISQNGANALAVTQSGSGTLQLTAANTYTGATTVSSGTLSLNAANAITSGLVTVSGGTLTENTADALNGTAALTVNNANSNAVLSAANHYSGATTLSNGNLQLRDANAMVSSALTTSGGTLQLRNDTNNTTFNYVSATIGTSTINVDKAGTGSGNTLKLGNVSIGASTVTLTNGSSYNLGVGAVTATDGSTFTNNMVNGTLTLASINETNAATKTVTFNGTSASAVTSVGGITQATIATNITQSGSGTLQITGASSYTGTTTVSSGVLTLVGASGAITSNSAITISGTGTLLVDDRGASSTNNNRLNNSSTIGLSSGGTFSYIGSDQTSTNSTESIGVVTLSTGTSTITTNFAGTNTATVSAAAATGGLARTATTGGIALLNGVNLGQDSTSTASVARFITATAPTLVGTTAPLATGDGTDGNGAGAAQNTQIVPYLRGESAVAAAGKGTSTGFANTFLTYTSGTGYRPLNPTDEFTNNAIIASNNTYITAATTAATTAAINSLVINGGDLAINDSTTLTDTSGAVLFVSNNTIMPSGTTGTLGFGSAAGIISVNSGVTGIISSGISGTGGLTIYGPGILVANVSAAAGYTGNWSVSASGTLMPGSDTGLGTGAVTLQGGGKLKSDSQLRTVANKIAVSALPTLSVPTTSRSPGAPSAPALAMNANSSAMLRILNTGTVTVSGIFAINNGTLDPTTTTAKASRWLPAATSSWPVRSSTTTAPPARGSNVASGTGSLVTYNFRGVGANITIMGSNGYGLATSAAGTTNGGYNTITLGSSTPFGPLDLRHQRRHGRALQGGHQRPGPHESHLLRRLGGQW